MADQSNRQDSSSEELTAHVQETLRQSVQSHTGAECIVHEDYVFIRIDGINAVLCKVFWCRLQPNGQYLAQVGFQLIPDPPSKMANRGLGMLDMLAGWGFSPELAVENGVSKWMHSVFLAAFPALSPQTPHDKAVTVSPLSLPQSVTNPIREWNIYQGPMVLTGQADDYEALKRQLKQTPPFPALIEHWLINAISLQQTDLHWLKLFLGRSNGRVYIECQFNNEEQPTLIELMRSHFVWLAIHNDTELLSFKQYFVIVPATENRRAPR